MTCSSRSTRSIRAQSSVEYLIVLAAFLAALSLLIAPLMQSYRAALFWMEVQEASSFLQRFESSVQTLSLMAPDSAQSIEFNASSTWLLESDNTAIHISLSDEFLKKTKNLSAELDQPVGFSRKELIGKGSIVLQKTADGISVQ